MSATATPTTLERAHAASNPTTREQNRVFRETNETRREQNQAAPTAWESDIGSISERSQTSILTANRPRFNLPPDVALNHEWIRDNPNPGTEADSAVLRNRRTGREVFFKYYRRNMRPDMKAMELLQRADRSHVVEIIETHDDASDTWEIQEFCPLGSLKDWVARHDGPLDESELKEIVSEICAALKHLNEQGLTHGDLKPANVLVRNEKPLDLVLTDFGLARANQELTHATQHARGTWLYAAPEIHEHQPSMKSDWFSFGAMVFEFLTGRCLFSNAQGDPELPEVASYRCRSREYTTIAIENARWRDLVDGLLTYDRKYRWKAAHVESWLRGESPRVAERHEATSAGGAARPQYYKPEWSDELITTPKELTEALRKHWSLAASALAGRERNTISTFLKGFPDTSQAIDIVQARDYSPESKMVRIQALFDPDATPEYRGEQLSAESIQSQMESAQAGDDDAAQWLSDLVDNRILKAYGEYQASPVYANADDLLAKWKEQVDQVASMVPDKQRKLVQSAYRQALPDLFNRAFYLGADNHER